MISKVNAATQAKLNAAREEFEAKRAKANKAAAARRAAKAEAVDVEATEIVDDESTMKERIAAQLADAGPKRYVVGQIVAFAAGTGCATVVTKVVTALSLGALAVTGSAFLATAIWAIGFIVAFIVGWKVGGFVSDYIITKKVDAHYEYVKSFFTSSTPIVEA